MQIYPVLCFGEIAPLLLLSRLFLGGHQVIPPALALMSTRATGRTVASPLAAQQAIWLNLGLLGIGVAVVVSGTYAAALELAAG